MRPKGDSPLKRESTSIKIRPDVWKNAKIEAIKQDIELSELVEKALEAFMNENENKEKQKK
jgi:predicted HicB family RNase H-like nuclease